MIRTYTVVFPKNGTAAFTCNITGSYHQVMQLLETIFKSPVCSVIGFNKTTKDMFSPDKDTFVILGYTPNNGISRDEVWADIITH